MDGADTCDFHALARRLGATLLLGVVATLLVGASPSSEAPVLRLLHVVETHETLGLPDAAGLAFPPGVSGLLRLDDSIGGTWELLAASDPEVLLASFDLADTVLMTLDGEGRVVLLDAATHELTRISGAGHVERTDLSPLGLERPLGASIDPATGRLFVLEAEHIVVVEPGPRDDYRTSRSLRGKAKKIVLPRGWVRLRGLAFDPESGHLHLYSPQTRELFELDLRGKVEAVRELPEGEGDLRAMVFAPSRDRTDAPERTSLFLATTGLEPAQTTEWSLHPDPTAPEVEVVKPRLVGRKPARSGGATSTAPAASGDPTFVRTIDTWRFDPPSPDSAGIAYVPGSGSLLMSDSEVNEMGIYQGRNMFELTPSGSLFRTWDTTSYSGEPTGVAYNPTNGHAYISDDSDDVVWIVDPRAGGVFGDGNDVVTSLKADSLGATDPEGVAYSAATGLLYIVDGLNREIYEVDPGPDGQFDNKGDSVRHFDTLSLGVSDPEGITVDTATGNLYVVGKPSGEVREITPGGTLVRVLDISAADPDKPAGLAFGPTSVDPGQVSLYIASRGVDNNKDPFENDGEIYEFSLGDFVPGDVNEAPSVVARDDATVLAGETVPLHGSVDDDGNPDPPGAIQSIAWSQDEGPEDADIDNPNQLVTTVSFPTAGTYVLRLTAFDGQLSAADSVTFTVNGPNGEVPIDLRVVASSDDAEERGGSVKTTSSDLEMTLEKTDYQTVGLRFLGLDVPRFATIEEAWIQFHADEAHADATNLTLAAEDTGDAATFLSAAGNISQRPRTSATASWSPPAWTTPGQAGTAQRTPDLSAIVQEVVNRDDWSAGNDLAIIITGTGKRTAESYDGGILEAPQLHVVYTLGGGPRNLAPSVEAGADQTLELGESTSVTGSVSDDGLPDPPGAIQGTTWSQVNGPPYASVATPGSLTTGLTFPSDGSYRLRLAADDGEKTGSDELTITVNPPPPPPGQNTVEVRIGSSLDDAEERGDLDMKITSSDLEMTLEKGANQVVGLRFHPLEIPPGARIDQAWVQFQVDEATTVQTNLRIEAQASGDAPPFADVDGNLSGRPTTAAFVDWSVPEWPVRGAAGAAQRTPDLSNVIDSVVNGGSWQLGNALVLLVTGTGERVAESYDGEFAGAPLLHVTFTVE